MTKRRKRKPKRARRALGLRAWRALILAQTMRDLAMHGRLNALAALVLSAPSEVRDMETFSLLTSGVMSAERVVRAQLQRDSQYRLWAELQRIKNEEQSQ